MAYEVSGTPNPLSNDSQKDSEAFGLKVLKSCYDRWRKGVNGESWEVRQRRFEKNRLYAMGKQPTSQFRDIVKVEGSIAVVNLDYSPLPIAIPFLNRLKDRYNKRIEKIRCSAIDPFTQNKKREAKESERFKLQYGDNIKELQAVAGMELEEFRDDDPKDERELDIKFGFTYKEREEIIMELGIDVVFYDNDWWDVIKDRIFEDMYNCGYAVTNTKLDSNGRIKTPWVKPEDFITSYSEFTDFRDWQWQGERFNMSIMEIRRMYGKKVSEEKLFELAKSCAGKYGNAPDYPYQWSYEYTSAIARPYDAMNVEVVDLYYKTLYNLTYEKNRDRFGKEILDKAKTEKEGKEYEKSKPYYVAYRGVWIVGTDIMLEWGLAKNMIKPEDNLTEVYSPYTIYMPNNTKGNNTPLVETMIPSIDMMQLLQLQSQKIIAMTAPDGYNIDVTGLSDIDMGQGVGVVSPMQLFSIYLQTGNQYFKGTSDENNMNEGGRQQPPITPGNHIYSNKLEQLDAKWEKEYNKLMLISGSNNLDAGNITNQATANSTLNDARDISASSTNYMYNGYLNIFKGTAKRVQMRLWDKFVYGEGSYDGYRMALGKDNVEYIKVEATDDFEKTNFDVKIEAVVDDAEQQRLNQRIDIALANKEITLQDAIELDFIENVRYKAVMLAARSKKKYEDDIKQAKINSEDNTKAAIAAAEAKSKGDMDLETMQQSNKLQLLTKETDAEAVKEGIKFSGILKAKVVDAILSKPTGNIEEIPDFIWSSLGLTDAAQKQYMVQAIQQSAMEEQNMQQQAQLSQEQQNVPQEAVNASAGQEVDPQQLSEVA